MRAIYKNTYVDVWEISRTNEQPDWVKVAFEKRYLVWINEKELRIMMDAMDESELKRSKRSFSKFWHSFIHKSILYPSRMFATGNIGDYLDLTNQRVVTKKQFNKKYRIVDC